MRVVHCIFHKFDSTSDVRLDVEVHHDGRDQSRNDDEIGARRNDFEVWAASFDVND